MAIVPKRKHSQARRDKRRSNVWKLEAPTLVKCPQCGELKVPHKVCGLKHAQLFNTRNVVNPMCSSNSMRGIDPVRGRNDTEGRGTG